MSDEPGYLGVTTLAMVIYGPPGVGKTELAAHFPDPGFLFDPQEPGILDLVRFKKAPAPLFAEKCQDWKETMKALDRVASGKLECGTLIMDSLTGFEKLCFHNHAYEHFGGDLSKEGFYAYQSGPNQAAKFDWSNYIDALDAIREAGISVILLGHTVIKKYENPDGPDYDRFYPHLHKEVAAQTDRWAQAILFYNYNVSVRKDRGKAKAKDGVRQLITEWTPAAEAKNRFGLPMYIQAGDSGKSTYEAFEEAFREAAGL